MRSRNFSIISKFGALVLAVLILHSTNVIAQSMNNFTRDSGYSSGLCSESESDDKCKPNGIACFAMADCCSGACNHSGKCVPEGHCNTISDTTYSTNSEDSCCIGLYSDVYTEKCEEVAPNYPCTPLLQECTESSDCCSGACSYNTCVLRTGIQCTKDNQERCQSNHCENYQCCSTDIGPCSQDDDCCDGLRCDFLGRCTRKTCSITTCTEIVTECCEKFACKLGVCERKPNDEFGYYGVPCLLNSNCASNICVDNKCSYKEIPSCLENTFSCKYNVDCCSGICRNFRNESRCFNS